MHKLATTGVTGLPIAQPSFHDTSNSIDPHISFTFEHENNCQISFLDTLVSRDNGKLIINVYRKPTHTDRCLDFHSHHDKNHKISTAATLNYIYHRATNLPNTDTGRNKEIKRVYTALESNGYPVNLITDIERKKRVPPPVPTPEELVRMFFKWVDPPHTREFATLPYGPYRTTNTVAQTS